MQYIKIGYFSNHFTSSKGHGISRYSRELYSALNELNDSHLNTVVLSASTHCSKEKLLEFKIRNNLQVLPLGRILTPLSWILLESPSIESMVDEEFDLVHSLSLGYKIATNLPYITTIHDIGPLTHPQFFTAKDRLFMKGSLKQAVEKAAAMICVSQATADEVEAYAKRKFNRSVKDRLHVVHEGVSNIFSNSSEEDDIIDSNLVSSLIDSPFILTVGQLSPRKNMKLVLDAFRELSDTFPSLKVITVGGNGWDYKMIEEECIAFGLQKKVHFLGYISDDLLRFLYRKALVFVYPSLFEGFGLTILEAMASGCPVITSNVSSLPEIAGDAAILINPEDPKDLVDALTRVYNNGGLRKQMIASGLNRASEFTWEKAAALTKEIYFKVINES